jgi:hypothetical protein
MLEEIWIRTHEPGSGTLYILSGFANYNGGARFYRTFKEHTDKGGRIVAILGGSASQNTSSRQVAEALLECGAEVHVTNRKSLMHAKCYGVKSTDGEKLIVTSGNFTGPGMAQNVEAALLLGTDVTNTIGFSWEKMIGNMLSQSWTTHKPKSITPTHPVWSLLYDETPGVLKIDRSEETTMIVKLSHSDTARIMAKPGTNAAKGTQYFWLSKDCFDFFPPLTMRNIRGYKGTLSALITMRYVDLGKTVNTNRITFEAENNYDFRLGTGPLRYTKLANEGDLACISRIGDAEYELRIFKKGSAEYAQVLPYATTFIGGKDKAYGYIDNQVFAELIDAELGE